MSVGGHSLSSRADIRSCELQELVEFWRRLPGCEREGDGWRSAAADVSFWCDDDGLLDRPGDMPAVEHQNGVRIWFEAGVQRRSAGGPSHVAPMPTHVALVREVDGGLPEMSGSMPYRRPRFTTLDTSSARTEQMVEEWTDSQGRVSRADGPARRWADGTSEYWVAGRRHRANGKPAIAYPRPYGRNTSGPDEWFEDGRRHRIAGPAREVFRDSFGNKWGTGEYYIYDTLVPDVQTRWSVLRHYTGAGERPRLDVDNVDAWDLLVAGGSVNGRAETIEPSALAAALRLHPN